MIGDCIIQKTERKYVVRTISCGLWQQLDSDLGLVRNCSSRAYPWYFHQMLMLGTWAEIHLLDRSHFRSSTWAHCATCPHMLPMLTFNSHHFCGCHSISCSFRRLSQNSFDTQELPMISNLNRLEVLYVIFMALFHIFQANLVRELNINRLNGTIPTSIASLSSLRSLCVTN